MKIVRDWISYYLKQKQWKLLWKIWYCGATIYSKKRGKILWNGQLYKISDVMYGFETSEEEYGFIVSPEIQTSIASDLSYKVWLEEVI